MFCHTRSSPAHKQHHRQLRLATPGRETRASPFCMAPRRETTKGKPRRYCHVGGPRCTHVRRLHFSTDLGEMNGFKLKDMVQFSLVVFVTSTTGQGEVPSNATRFWRNLRRQTLNGTNCLARVRFTIFGLGDSSYTKFNWAARKLRGRLLQLGASDFFRAGEGDERHDDG